VKKFPPRHLAIILGCYPEVANQAKQTTRRTKTMKTMIIGIVAMLGFTAALHAQKGERKGGDGQLFAKLDTDGDGMVSKQEWEANWSGKGKGKHHRGQEGAKGRKGHGARGAQDGQQAGPGKGKGRPGAGGAGRGAGGGKGGAR